MGIPVSAPDMAEEGGKQNAAVWFGAALALE